MQAGDEHQHSAPMMYLDEQGRYREGQGRPEPPLAGGEASTLVGFLERQRATFASKVGGLDAVGLRATYGPSAMTLGGMLKHLARFEDDMSAEWLQGRGQLSPWDTDPDWDWRTAADDTPEQLYALWQNAVTRSRSLFGAALAESGPERQAPQPALHPAQHDRGVCAAQRPCRPAPGVGRRARRA
jgi:hypothetical protein